MRESGKPANRGGLLVLVVLLAVASGALADNPRSCAILLTGNDETGGPAYGRGALQGAFDRNADRIATAFADSLGIASILRLHAEEIDERTFVERVEAFVSGVEESDTLIFYYAGHGTESFMQPFFVERIATPEGGPEGAEEVEGLYPYEDLGLLLRSAACRTVLILDACFSGSAVGLFDPSWTVIASCRADQRTLLAWGFGSVFNVEFTDRINKGHTRLDEILEGIDLMYGEEYQFAGDDSIDLASPTCP